MRDADLAQVADELYALVPAEFIAARDERARQARAAGDRDLADAIRKLRRPTVSAWLVNRLARDAPGKVGQVLDLAEPLREAQETLAGDRMRELSARRRELVAGITDEAKRLAAGAGQSAGAQLEREVAGTFEAALADPDAAVAVRSGRLTSPLSYAGFGGVDLSDAVAVPGAAPVQGAQPSGSARREGRAGTTKRAAARDEQQSAVARREAREAELAQREYREAESVAQEAEAAAAEAEQQVSRLREEHEAVRREIADLEQRLARAGAREAQLARAVRDARRGRDTAARQLAVARRRLDRAEARAVQHHRSQNG